MNESELSDLAIEKMANEAAFIASGQVAGAKVLMWAEDHGDKLAAILRTFIDLRARRALPQPTARVSEPLTIKLDIAKPPPWSYRDNDTFRWLPVALAGMTGVSDWIVKLPSGREHFIAQEDYEALSPMRTAPTARVSDEAVEAAISQSAVDAAYEAYTADTEHVSVWSKLRDALTAALPHLIPKPQDAEAVAWRWAHTDEPFLWNLQKAEPGVYMGASAIIKQPLYLHPSEGAVTIKPLDWDEGAVGEHGAQVWSSGDPWLFWIVKRPESGFIWCESLGFADMVPASPVRGSFVTLAEAKTAAQADYEARIRSALSLSIPRR